MSSRNMFLDFVSQPIYVGIDVHLKSWNVTIYSQDLFLKSSNILS